MVIITHPNGTRISNLNDRGSQRSSFKPHLPLVMGIQPLGISTIAARSLEKPQSPSFAARYNLEDAAVAVRSQIPLRKSTFFESVQQTAACLETTYR